jgi:hypothetical protein
MSMNATETTLGVNATSSVPAMSAVHGEAVHGVTAGGTTQPAGDVAEAMPIGEPAPIFSGEGSVDLTLSAPFESLFARKRLAIPKPQGPGRTVAEEGTVAVAGGTLLKATVELTGNTSLRELDFPKLKLKIQGVDGTAFDGAKNIKIGTHGGEDSAVSTLGRLEHEDATHRESFVYQALTLLGIPTRASRPANITYIDTEAGGEPKTRKAFLLEDPDKLAKRMGGVEVEEGPIQLDKEASLRCELANVFAGNWDWSLPTDNKPMGHNIKVIRVAGVDIPIPTDFDLAAAVTGRAPRQPSRHDRREEIPSRFEPDLPRLERWMAWELKRIGETYPADMVEGVLTELRQTRQAVEEALAGYPMDEAGRAKLGQQIATFYRVIASA